MANDIEIAPDLGAQMFPDETTEEALARIVAQNPLKHGVTIEQRVARALEIAKRASAQDLSGLSADDALIVSVGGDPEEMMTGNKPRWTVEGDTIKDHLEGKEFVVIAFRAPDDEQHTAALQQVMDGATALANQATCAHQWPDDPQPETPCALCGLSFERWANS